MAKREGLSIAEVFRDDDRSAFNGDSRPAFDRMLRELHRFDVVLFGRTDRLVRRTVQFFKVVEACERAGVRLASVTEQLDTAPPWARVLLACSPQWASRKARTSRHA